MGGTKVRIVKLRVHFLTFYPPVLSITVILVWIPFVICDGFILICCYRNAILYFSWQRKVKF